jgi:hypothetical protein
MLALIQHGFDVSLCHFAKVGGRWMGWGAGRMVACILLGCVHRQPA